MCAYRFIKLYKYNFASLFAKCRTQIKPNAILRQNAKSFSSAQFAMDNITKLPKDVLLYTFEKTKVIKRLTIFGSVQLVFWIFYGGFMFITLKDVSKTETDEALKKSSLWRRINLGDQKLRYASLAFCITIGSLTAYVCFVLPTRIIKELTLCKGGRIASIVTYAPFGRTQKHKIALKNLSCITSREKANTYIALKVKPRWFYYLIDIDGTFHEPKLFDFTVGAKSGKIY